MKNKLKLAIILLLFSCQAHPILKCGLEGKQLPSFKLLLTDSTTYLNTSEFNEGQPIVFVYVSPVCPFCRAQVEEIISNDKDLASIKFVILTPAPYEQLREFYNHFSLSKYKNITVGMDYSYFFANYFNATQVPYLALYDKHKKLKQVNLGKLPSKEIKEIAFQ
jgi:thiol-disulfide isomerase/thioredoxin